jgi:class 3 adenylate cyclase
MASAQRRLSAILHADVAGFVRLVEDEEDLTFQRLRAVRAEVWRPAIENAGGALVHSAGDSMLVEFNSARAAVQAAIDIQERMAQFNAELAEEQRLLFRIGVHLGEIIVDEDGHDIFGDGVNLAERIQTMAEPGGIAVSRAIRDVADLIGNYTYVDGGEQRAKHVSRPIQIFNVRARNSDSTFTSPIQPVRGTLRFRGTDHSGRRFGFDLEVAGLKQRQQSVVIGRDADQCEVVLAHPTVSRRHARLSVAADNKLQIEDLGSTNGTLVNGSPLAPGVTHPLDAGTRLTFGDIELVVRYD